MAHPFRFPVKLPRWTKQEFDQKRAQYTAKHGYKIVIPGFEDIFHYDINPEPTKDELWLYKNRPPSVLGEARYQQIKDLMAKKKRRFLQLLSSPTPRIAMNAASALTFLDDINDTLGTVGVVARTAARLLPGTAAKLLTGPAGWLFLAADITNIAMELSRLPWKAKRLQHDFHHAMTLNPLNKRARLRRLNKLSRLRLSKGEIIEGLQTTDNLFGIGISLGPIMGLLYDIPFGFYRAFQGRKVTVEGLPSPLYWADHVVNRFFRGCAQLWYGNPDFTDQELAQSMVAFNYATQWQKAYVGEQSPLDFIDDPSGIDLLAHRPLHPSTIDVIESEVGNLDEYLGWPSTGSPWMSTNDMFDNNRDQVIQNVKNWEQRNKRDIEGMVSIQNAVESSMNSLAILEGDAYLEYSFDSVTEAYLKMFNNDFRLPTDATPEQLDCFTKHLVAYGTAGAEPSFPEILRMAYYSCDMNLTRQVPRRPTPSDEELEDQARYNIERLRIWYFGGSRHIAISLCTGRYRDNPEHIERLKRYLRTKLSWLARYGLPEGQPADALSRIRDPQLRACVAASIAV